MTETKKRDSKEGWNIDELGAAASQKDRDEIKRQVLRGDESKGDPDDRDNAGKVASNETPQGREEAKNDLRGKANTNG
ncbi:MAG: hypothetical protein JSS81_02160 [Acidobacteria bacterium]|nr:hypothetical protein [Acidobacteriota bacterium]